MGDKLIIFGSKSDEPVFSRIKELLPDAELIICSAHRDPKRLEKILKKDYDFIVAGAGLAAHLPGVIASKTIRPVIGIPVKSNFGGLDAFLSIVQMPPGIPVLCLQNLEELKKLKKFSSVNLIGDQQNKRVQSCIEMLRKFNVEFILSERAKQESINIQFIALGKKPKPSDNFIIYVPLKEDTTAKDAQQFMESAKVGFWVGVNRGENAALAAIEILGKYKKQLLDYRASIK
jgi:5-(carboxyamino)imidazole ribonucleotide mutase